MAGSCATLAGEPRTLSGRAASLSVEVFQELLAAPPDGTLDVTVPAGVPLFALGCLFFGAFDELLGLSREAWRCRPTSRRAGLLPSCDDAVTHRQRKLWLALTASPPSSVRRRRWLRRSARQVEPQWNGGSPKATFPEYSVYAL